MGMLAKIWDWVRGKNSNTMADFTNMSPEAKFFYFVFQGTSKDDRQWMAALR